MLEIRPHHLLCIPGYKGLNYNKESINNWTKIVSEIKSNPNLEFRMVLGEDSLCKECKYSKNNGGSCDKNFVEKLDRQVKKILGLKESEVYVFDVVKNKLSELVNFKKHEDICKDCGWWKQGLCHDTFSKS